MFAGIALLEAFTTFGDTDMMAKKLGPQNLPITSNVLNPGYVFTEMRHLLKLTYFTPMFHIYTP